MTARRLVLAAAAIPVIGLILSAVAAITLDRILDADDRLIRGVNT